MASSLFGIRAGVTLEHVPYRGGSAAVQLDLIANRLDFTIGNVPALMGGIFGGRITPLAVAYARRWPALLEVPTMAEAGLDGVAALGFQGDLLGDSGFKGAPFTTAALAHDIHVSVSPGGRRDGHFLPNGIRWVVERLFAWLSRYRRLDIVYDRAADLFAGHIWIAMISLIARRLVDQTQTQQGV